MSNNNTNKINLPWQDPIPDEMVVKPMFNGMTIQWPQRREITGPITLTANLQDSWVNTKRKISPIITKSQELTQCSSPSVENFMDSFVHKILRDFPHTPTQAVREWKYQGKQ